MAMQDSCHEWDKVHELLQIFFTLQPSQRGQWQLSMQHLPWYASAVALYPRPCMARGIYYAAMQLSSKELDWLRLEGITKHV